MTTANVVQPSTDLIRDATQETDQQCGACDHLATDHDAISARFCRATESQALVRKCICPKAARLHPSILN